MTATSAPAAALLGVYARVGPVFAGGDGAELIAEDGTRYLDFVAGIAVNALGYNSPVIREAVLRALDAGLIHVSNLYRTEPGERLAAEPLAFGAHRGEKLGLGDRAHDVERHRRHKGSATERRGVVTGRECRCDRVIHEDRSHRQPAPERLRQRVHVGDDARRLGGKQRPGAPEAALHFVEDQCGARFTAPIP